MTTDAHSPTALFTPAPGQVLGGRFRVERTIGVGGMGVVVEATNTLTGKRVAIKWMHPTVAAHPESAQRFVREAQASARVRHPNVIDVYDVVRDGESLFLVMELLDGEPLSSVLARGGYPAHELVAVLIDAMRGVSAAHKQGVIHRDIKPDNIFLTRHPDREQPVPKVLDFGISKLAGGGEGLGLTRTGTTMGTPMYMSFEQLCNAKDIDQRTDVYAFAVILYEALTGQTPYHAETFAELVVKVTSTIPPTPKTVQPAIPEELDRVVVAAMAKDRDQRTATIDALITGLKPFATQAGYAAAANAPRKQAVGPDPITPLPASRIDPERMSTPMSTSVVPPDAIPRSFHPMRWVMASAVALIGGGLWIAQSGGGAGPEAAIDAPHAPAAEAHVVAPAPQEPALDKAPDPTPRIAAPSHAAAPPPSAAPAKPAVTATNGAKATATGAKDAGVSNAVTPATAARDARHRPHEARTDRTRPPRPGAQPKPPQPQPGAPATPSTVLRAGRVHADDF